MEDISQLGEQGTVISGYEEKGKYHCGDCIHRINPKSDICIHPVVIVDPELQDRMVAGQGIRVDLEKGCCSFVNQTRNPVMLVLRHGETVLNKDKKFRSLKNVPLDDTGVEQAESAAAFLKNYPIKYIVCSPLDRSYHTGMLVQQDTGAQIDKDSALLPWNLGELSGKPRNEYAEVLNHFTNNPDQEVPGGESLHQFRDTMFAAFDKYVAESSWDNLYLLVAHTSTVTTLCQWADNNYTGRPETDDESVQPGGVAGLYFDGEKYEVQPIFGDQKKADYGS